MNCRHSLLTCSFPAAVSSSHLSTGSPGRSAPVPFRGLPVIVLLSVGWRHRRVCEQEGRPRAGLETDFSAPYFREAAREPALSGFPPYFLRLETGRSGESGCHICHPRTGNYFGVWEAAHELGAFLGTGTNGTRTTAYSPLPIGRRGRRHIPKAVSRSCRLWGRCLTRFGGRLRRAGGELRWQCARVATGWSQRPAARLFFGAQVLRAVPQTA